MHCPFCGEADTKVIDSRLVAEGDQVRRRRECLSCKERFTTFETAELVMPRVVKQDGTRQPFDEDKLRSGIMKALEQGYAQAGFPEMKFDQDDICGVRRKQGDPALAKAAKDQVPTKRSLSWIGY